MFLPQFVQQIARLFRPNPTPARRPSYRRRPQVEILEDRSLPSASGIVSGVAFFDNVGNGIRVSQDSVLGGVTIGLEGTTNQGAAVNLTTTTNTGGLFSFLNLQPGTYHFDTNQAPLLPGYSTGLAGGNAAAPFTVADGQVVNQDLAFYSYAPSVLSLRLFFSSATSADLPATLVQNNQPYISNPIQNVAVTKNTTTPTVIDLTGAFNAPNLTDPIVQFDVSTDGGTTVQPINVQLFNQLAPQTVANFLNYVESGSYNNTIFHRIQTTTPNGISIFQGGGFTFSTSPSALTALSKIDPTIASEFGVSNTTGTLAMALTSAGPNSGTNEFFFNTGNNAASLDPQSFTVFGRVVSSTDQTTLTNLASQAKSTDESSSNPNFANIPLYNNYTGTNFPTDTTASNYAIVEDVKVTVPSAATLSYAVIGNTNPGLVTASLGNNLAPIDSNLLTLKYAAKQTGTAVITVRATDSLGGSITTSFTVTVS